MVIGLMGFELVSPNKGCEALSYSFLKMLEETIGNQIEIVIIANTKKLGDVRTYFPNFEYDLIPENMKDIKLKMFRAMKRCDYIFDITMGDSFSDIYAGKACRHTILEKRIAEILCKKYVLLPQTYGPFNIPSNEKAAMKVISKAWKVYSRDELSKKYIEELLPYKYISLTTDLAFSLPYQQSFYKIEKCDNCIKLGINISGLLWRGGFDSDNQFGLSLNYKEYINELIKKYSNDEKYRVYLIPHVIDFSENAHDDDYQISKQISNRYNVILSPAFTNPIQAKSYISNMDCFIGARMHSTIAAFSSGVATIPFSYSRKFEGLYNQLGYNYIIKGTSLSIRKALEKTYTYINFADSLRKIIADKMKVIDKILRDFREEVSSIFSNN